MKNKINKKMSKEFNLLKKENGKHFRVAIFGSSKIGEGDKVYKDVNHLAKCLGEKGVDVITGGGPGLMQAANEGHRLGTAKTKNKAHSIGIGVELPWNQHFNNGVEYKEKFNRFSKRLDEFMLLSNAVVVAPGGLGTILELFYTWQLVQVHHICNIPIILMGDTWKGLLKWIKTEPLANEYLEKIDFNLVFHVKDSKEAMKLIEDSYDHFKKDGKNFCLNYKKYKIK